MNAIEEKGPPAVTREYALALLRQMSAGIDDMAAVLSLARATTVPHWQAAKTTLPAKAQIKFVLSESPSTTEAARAAFRGAPTTAPSIPAG